MNLYLQTQILVQYVNRLYVTEHKIRGHKSTQYASHPKFSCVDWRAPNNCFWWQGHVMGGSGHLGSQPHKPAAQGLRELAGDRWPLRVMSGKTPLMSIVIFCRVRGWGSFDSLCAIRNFWGFYKEHVWLVNERMAVWQFLLPMNWSRVGGAVWPDPFTLRPGLSWVAAAQLPSRVRQQSFNPV